MKVRALHPWDLGIREAIGLQRALCLSVVPEGEVPPLRRVAGCDVAYDLARGVLYGGAVIWDLEGDCLVEEVVVADAIPFPYVPGLLTFREAPVLLEALSQIDGRPQVVLVDGQGIAHPRSLGLASHLGLHLDTPTVGCAKGRLLGTHGPLGSHRGDWVWLEAGGRRVGAALRTRDGVKPLYVSPGHRIGVREAVRAVLSCLGRFRLPEPLRQAHLLVERHKRLHRWELDVGSSARKAPGQRSPRVENRGVLEA